MGEERKRVSVPPHAANPRRGRSTGTRRTPSRQHHPLITARPPTSCSSPLLPPQTHLNPKSHPYQSKWSRLVRAIHFSIWNSPSASIFIDQTPASSKDLGVSTFEHLERSASLSACLLLSTALPRVLDSTFPLQFVPELWVRGSRIGPRLREQLCSVLAADW